MKKINYATAVCCMLLLGWNISKEIGPIDLLPKHRVQGRPFHIPSYMLEGIRPRVSASGGGTSGVNSPAAGWTSDGSTTSTTQSITQTGGVFSLGNGCLTLSASTVTTGCTFVAGTGVSWGLGANSQLSLGSGVSRFNIEGLADSVVVPTLTGWGGTGSSVSAHNGTAAFDINVGTVAPGSGGTVNFPTASTGWECSCRNKTSPSSVNEIRVSSDTSASVVLSQVITATNVPTNFNASDHVRCMCRGL